MIRGRVFFQRTLLNLKVHIFFFNTQPPAEVLKKNADALDTTVDYLINGDTDEKAKSALTDTELLQQFKAVEQMNEADRTVIKKLIDAFITKGKIKPFAL